MIENKLIYTIINFIMRMLNIMIIMPLVLSVGLVILALCLVNITLCIAFLLGALKIFIPILPINFALPVNVGANNIIVKLLIVCIIAILGYYLYQFLHWCVPGYLGFLGDYMKKSFMFF
ncbi:hypothetical protein CHL78_008515 [Romboutsia weinsteinii]|uniref:Uncharacterized protein n=1 Tax=Romboutsia weinsteinii TaxID=2020949 RepID=A0A255IIY4_9FIRM|nr:hypothetical protein [Romboutsia weinsteinii]RDY27753.1 hypothetical protein CHL78_008515 [Romboutsia weinsteinii]